MLTRACVENNIEVECLPGATAFVPDSQTAACQMINLFSKDFYPTKKVRRQTRFLALAEENRTMIFYVSPHKLNKTLAEFAQYFGSDRPLSVSRELSKMHEETVRGNAEEVLKTL